MLPWHWRAVASTRWSAFNKAQGSYAKAHLHSLPAMFSADLCMLGRSSSNYAAHMSSSTCTHDREFWWQHTQRQPPVQPATLQGQVWQQGHGLSDHHHHHQNQQQQQQQQQQQSKTPGSWLQLLARATHQERLSHLSQLAIVAQGTLAQVAAHPSQTLSAAAAALLPQAALAATATAAVPGSATLAMFQGTRYQGPSGLSSAGRNWLRQFGMDDSRVTTLLVTANICCFGLQLMSPTFTSLCVRDGGMVAAGQYWRLVTAAFVHGGVLHVAINTIALWNIGRMVEAQLGPKAFLTVYLGSAVIGNVLGLMYNPIHWTSMGSSGAIAGLLGAYLAHAYINRHSVYVSSAVVTSVLQTIGINLAIMTLFSAHLDNWTHLGGLVGGAAIAAFVAPRYSR